MKLIKYFSILAIIALLSACYDDKGNYNYVDINEVEISGIEEKFEVDRFDIISISPSLQGSLAKNDESSYTYEWYLDKTLIAETRDLNFEVTSSIGSYTLKLVVTDTSTGTKAFNTSTVVVNSASSSDGILVVSNQNGFADLSYLRLDKEGAQFSAMFYNKNYDEPLATNVKKVYQTFADGYPNYAKLYGGQGIKILSDEGVQLISNITLEKNGAYDANFFLKYGSLYPVPDYSNYKPEYIYSIVYQWRLNPYGSMMTNEDVWVIANGGIYQVSYSRTASPSISKTNFRGGSLNAQFSPMILETGRTPTPIAGKNLHAGWTRTYTQVMFDENTGGFYSYYTGINRVDDKTSFPGYRAIWGEDTYQSGFDFVVLENGSTHKFCTFNMNASPVSISSVDAPVALSKSHFCMLRNSPYVYFNDEKGVYRYNVLNVASGIPASSNDCFLTLSDLGYGSDAKITDIVLHRAEKKMLIAVSKYGSDTEGNSDDLKGDIVEISLDGTNFEIVNKWQGVCGAEAKVIYKYRTFARNDEYIVD